MKLELPSHRIVELELTKVEEPEETALFSTARRLFETCTITEKKRAIDVGSLELRDFHALRAVATKKGFLPEEAVNVPCRNCDEVLVHCPCAALEIGPFEECALNEPELDASLDLAAAHAVLDLGAVRFTALTLDDALPLHAALARSAAPLRKPLVIRASVVRAMGIAQVGTARDPKAIARAVARCSEPAWRTLTNLFLSANYSPRLFSIARCPACGARNDVDAPYDREFAFDDDSSGVEEQGSSNDEPFIAFEAFADRAREIAYEILPPSDEEDFVFLVEGGVAACDEGGDPLLGSYLPPAAGDAGALSRPPEIAVFYRTFRAMWQEDGPYDWEDELRETVEHEYEHHGGHLRGDDPVDDEEREEIDRERVRIVGKRALATGEVRALGADITLFMRRTWPLWLILVLVTILLTMTRGSD